ncbi:cupin domain-containing protein [Methanocalculus taiwanensis]|nr:cupin domain-containing protein [Methanocalculus taiwanensis]
MQKLILIPFILLLFTAGCITATPPAADEPDILLITPSDPFPTVSGQGTYVNIIIAETITPPVSYNLGYVTIPPGNATPPHRLLGTSELVYVIGGAARIHCDSKTVEAAAGELVLLPEGVLQSIESIGEDDLRYLSANQPQYTYEIDIRDDGLIPLSNTTNAEPIVIPDPAGGIEWDFDTGTLIYTLINPVLMPEMDIPIDYSAAYAQILPGGSIVGNRLTGSTDLIYVVEGEITIRAGDGVDYSIPAGYAALFPPGKPKEISNAGNTDAVILSVVDPAWRPEIFEMTEE